LTGTNGFERAGRPAIGISLPEMVINIEGTSCKEKITILRITASSHTEGIMALQGKSRRTKERLAERGIVRNAGYD